MDLVTEQDNTGWIKYPDDFPDQGGYYPVKIQETELDTPTEGLAYWDIQESVWDCCAPLESDAIVSHYMYTIPWLNRQ